MADMEHWAQFIRQPVPRFCRFDLGSECTGRLGHPKRCNMQAYGTPEPPLYDVSTIRTPLALFSGEMPSLDTGVAQSYLLPALHGTTMAARHCCCGILSITQATGL